MEDFANVVEQVKAERQRQIEKFGFQNFKMTVLHSVLMEEVGEANQAYVDAILKFKPTVETLDLFRKELIQVAAMALQIQDVYVNRYPESSGKLMPWTYIKDLVKEAIEEMNLVDQVSFTERTLGFLSVLTACCADFAVDTLSFDRKPFDSEFTVPFEIIGTAISLIMFIDRNREVIHCEIADGVFDPNYTPFELAK